MRLTAIIPTYNEAENLPHIVEAVLGTALPGFEVSLLVVDDNSPDGTGRLADEAAEASGGRMAVLHRPGKAGLGPAYVAGMRRALAAGADVVLLMDADFSHHPRFLPEMAEKIADFDVVVGSRYTVGGSVDPDWPTWRKVVSAGGGRYARAILGLKVNDPTAGFKMLRRAVVEALPLDSVRSNGYAFTVEIAYHCERLGFRVAEVPIRFDDRTRGVSKMSWRIALEAAWRVWQIRLGR